MSTGSPVQSRAVRTLPEVPTSTTMNKESNGVNISRGRGRGGRGNPNLSRSPTKHSPGNFTGPNRGRGNPRIMNKNNRGVPCTRVRRANTTANPRQQFAPPAKLTRTDSRKRSATYLNGVVIPTSDPMNSAEVQLISTIPKSPIRAPDTDPRSTFRDQKGSHVSSSMPGGISPQRQRPQVGQISQVKISNSDLSMKLKSTTEIPTPGTEKLKRISSYPDRTGTHSLLSTNEQFRGNIATFDNHLRAYLQSISEPEIRVNLSNRLFSSRKTYKVPAVENTRNSDHATPLRRTRSATASRMEFMNASTQPIQNDEWDKLLEEKEENLIFSESDGLIKGGTVECIVRTITNPKFASPGCLNAFLLTYRAFATPLQLLELLITRFHVKSSRSQDAEFKQYFEERKRKPIQLRTGNCIRRWLDNHWYDFENDNQLVVRLLDWIRGPLSRSKFGTLPKTLENLVDKKLQGGPRGGIKFTESTPNSIFPKTDHFIDFSPKEVARQLALIEFKDYVQIHPTECMHQSWTKEDKEKLSPHIGAMIRRSNSVPMWVATQILVHTDSKQKLRAKMITLFIKIMKECNKLNNFNAVMEIMAGLSLSPIHRLGKSWELVAKKHLDTLNSLKELMTVTGNWAQYRATLKQRDPPCLPYFGMYLTDLTFIEDGHPDYIEGRADCINFIKCRQLAVVIQDIQQYQQKNYSFRDVPVIQGYLSALEHKTDDELYALSLEVEPRQPKTAD